MAVHGYDNKINGLQELYATNCRMKPTNVGALQFTVLPFWLPTLRLQRGVVVEGIDLGSAKA